ncbi:MAG: nucleoside deaminase [Bacteroidota bacterium]
MELRFMEAAVQHALDGIKEDIGGPFGAVVVRNGEIISMASNSVTSLNDPTAHAEVLAIRRACQHLNTFQLTDCELYTTCEPCPMCLGAIYWARLGRVFFASTREDAAAAGFDDAFLYDEIGLPLEKRSLPIQHMSDSDAHLLFDAWNGKDDKIRY